MRSILWVLAMEHPRGLRRKFSTKIVIIGDGRVGKTSLRRAYLGKSFKSNYLSTIGADFSVTEYQVDSLPVQVTIWDIAGQQIFNITHGAYFRGAHAAIVMYDVTNKESFDQVKVWIDRYVELSNIGNIIAIVGNKIDLLEVPNITSNFIVEDDQHKKVEELRKLFPDYFISSYRTSAKTGKNIQACVEETVRKIVDVFINEATIKDKPKPRFEDYIPAAYITLYDELIGPTIIKKSPSYDTFSDKEFVNSIKVASTIDVEALAGSSSVEASMPWNDPRGYFHYIAFIDLLSSSSNIYIIGFVCLRDINDLILSNYELVSGFMHKAMNQFNEAIKSHETESIEEIAASTVIFDELLLNFRLNIFKVIEID
ncbi:MAG: GTP-binding protein [Candidatus Heimdallarchaeota archaeon]|nr:GTP-binding protein [Candidatus Heimdallarchaeota archaeon]